MTNQFRILLLIAAMLLTSCVTSRKTYHPPKDAKVKAATVDLNVKVGRARDTAKKAKTATKEAKAKVIVLREKAPPEMKPLVAEVDEALSRAIAWNTQLEIQLREAETARSTLQAAQDEYAGGAAGLAQDATNERNFRIAAEKQLMKEKWLSLLWKLGGGAVALGIIALIVLWFTGKLAFKFAK